MYTRFILNNGLKVIITPFKHVKSVSLAFFVRAGGCYEDESQAGVSHFIEHLCFKGTATRKTSREISEPIESTGGIINGGTDKELTVYWCRISSKYFRLALEILVDILRNSLFDEEEIEKERNVIAEEINMNYDNPQQRVETMIYKLLWPDQPLGRDVLGYKHTIQNFSREKLFNYYKFHYIPSNIVVSICGDIVPEDAIELIEKYTGDWDGYRKAVRGANLYSQDELNLMLEYRDIEQVQVCLGFHGLPLTHDDRFAVDILNTILGDGMSSRLFTEIREKHGLVYDIGSSVDHFLDAGSIIIHAALEVENISLALPLILEQIYKIRSDVTLNELNKAKEMIKGRLVLALENTYSISSWLGTQEILLDRIYDVEEIIKMIDNVTLNDVMRVANELISSRKLNVAMVGPLESEESIRKLLI